MMWLERRIWPNLIYFFLFILITIMIWQMTLPLPPLATIPSQYSTTPTYTLYTSNSSGYSYAISSLPLNDYNQLIDLNFTFTILNLVCNESSPLLLVLVHSSAGNFVKRKTIRETWGGNSNQIRVVFMIGLVDDNSLQKRLDEENDMYGDFVQGTFRDTYRNITYKHVMLFKYAIYHCPQAKYILKTDDDVFVNMPTMMSFLKGDLSPYGASRVLICRVRSSVLVDRTYRSKWRVSFSEYPHRKYPNYCLGWALLYSQDVIFDLYKQAQRTDYFWIDDVHITGTLMKNIHRSHTNIKRLVLTWKTVTSFYDSAENISTPFLYGPPNLNERLIRSLWNLVKSRPAPHQAILQMVEREY